MKLIYLTLLGTVLVSLNAVAAGHQRETLDACLKQAQESYDACEELGREMEADTERTHQAAEGKELKKGTCMKHLLEDQQKCRAEHPASANHSAPPVQPENK